MICLGLDTSGKRAHLAVVDGSGTLVVRSSDPSRKHSETLLAILREALGEAEMTPRDINLIAVGLGPGAWTGLRMGITTAKALAYALRLPIVGISSLETVAAGVEGFVGRLLVVVDARRGEAYGEIFEIDRGGDVRGNGVVFTFSPGEAHRVIPSDCALVGDGVSLFSDEFLAERRVLSGRYENPDAAVLCRRAIARFEERGGDRSHEVVPIYVRRSDAEINREKKENGI